MLEVSRITMEKKLIRKKNLLLAKGNKDHLAVVCNDLAELYMREGKYELSKNEYKNEAELYKELDKPLNYAQVNRMIGEICTTMAEFDEALKYEQIHLDIARELNNELEQQRALASIGRTYLTKAISDPEKISEELLKLAHASFLQSLSICDGLKDIKKEDVFDMRARLYLNIGVVKEYQNEFERAEEFMTKSIQICKNYDIFEQLQHGYYTLGLMHSKNENYNQAITDFNLALAVASRLTDNVLRLCATYMAKSEVLLKLREFTSAKHTLIKAYKLKSPNEEERNCIEHNLKVVVAMCQIENVLMDTPVTEHKKRKEFYEKMGDGAADLKIFDIAIDYYKQMLDCAIACGESGKDLVPVYVSLAQTYKDNKQYKMAYEYFQKDYEISRSNPEESYKTLLNIGLILELSKSTYDDVMIIYTEAKKEAFATENKKNVGKVLSHIIRFQKNVGKHAEAAELANELNATGYESSDSENDSEADNGTPDIGNDIDIELNLSDVSDGEETSELPETRKRGRHFRVKKNPKGETQLHTACIKGDVGLVMSLLDQKHPVNVRDFCGWTPFHEACNHGHLEIVRLLINKGANVNDRDGIMCKGYTPLHDACVNGHLEVVELLLENGASPIAQTDTGKTPLDLFKNWRETIYLDPSTETLYKNLVHKMKNIFEKAGRSISQSVRINQDDNDAVYVQQSKNTPRRASKGSPRKATPRKSPLVTPKKSSPYGSVGSLRHSIDVEDIDKPSCSGLKRGSLADKTSTIKRNLSLSIKDAGDFDNSSPACNEYKRAIEGLRNRIPEPKTKSPRSIKETISALVSDDDVVDNWLEDDLKTNTNKKRKCTSNVRQSLLESDGIRKTNSNSPRTIEVHSDNEQENTVPNINHQTGYESSDSISSGSNNNKRKRSQSSLLESGFSRNRSDSPLNTVNCNSPVRLVERTKNKTYKRQQKLNTFVNNNDLEPDSTSHTIITENSLPNTLIPLLAVNVRIENKLWRIPVPTTELNLLTIEWLAKEAAKRYYKQEGISPTLQLLTKEGAILVNEDPLSMIFISHTCIEEIQSYIVSWNLPSLPERYLEACASLRIESCPVLRKRLDECQGTLNLQLANNCIKKDQIAPLIRAINRQNNLYYINISNNRLQSEVVQQLCFALPSLVQLRSLDLSKNNITGEGIRFLSEIFNNAEQPLLENLIDLNLSFNVFGEDTLQHFAVILKKLKLRILNLSGCNLPSSIFDYVHNRNIILNLDFLETFDLSYNDLNSAGVIKFVSFLNFSNISHLNVSHNSKVHLSGIVNEIVNKLSKLDINNIKTLNLAKCEVNDVEIWDLLRKLAKSEELDSINLSFNPNLSAVSLRRLLQHRPSFSSINLLGCTNLLQYFEPFMFSLDSTNGVYYINNLKHLKLSINYIKYSKEANFLTEMWEKEWGKRARIKRLKGKAITFSLEE